MSGTTSLAWVLVLLSTSRIDMCAAECTLPEPPEQGQFIYESTNPPNEVSDGYTIRVVCNGDARIHPAGAGYMTCSSGDWSPTYDCRSGCEPLSDIPHGAITYRDTRSGQIARHFCTTPGYRLIGAVRNRRCLEDFTWSGSEPRCRPIPTCPIIEVPPGVESTRLNGRFLEDLWTIGSNHSFTCRDPGYYMDLPAGTYPAIRCLRTGWNATVPTCNGSTCAPLLDEIENGRTTAENRTYNLRESIDFICNPGYRTTSPSWRVCAAHGGREGVWDGITPDCEVTECPALPQIEHGTTISDSVGVGGNGTFRCRSGYTLIGDARITCLSTGQWNGTMPVCEDEYSAYCPTLGAPLNGWKEGDLYQKYSEVTFHCNPGYVRIGSETRRCQPDGQWNGETTRCMGPKDFDDIDLIAATLGESLDGLKASVLQENVIDPASFANGSQHARFIPLTHEYGVDLYFMFDGSGSVGQVNFDRAKKFAKDLVKEIGVTASKNSLRVGAMYFGSESQVAFHTIYFDNTEDVVNALNDIPYVGGGTNIVDALELVREVLIPQSRFRPNSFRTAFLITDGEATEGGTPTSVAQELKAEGIMMHCLGVSENASKIQLNAIASDPKREYLFFLKDYISLGRLVKAVTNQTIDYSECGISRNSVAKSGATSAEETLANEGAWPWQVYLEVYKTRARASGVYSVCGGTLVRNDTILTAAHCVEDFVTLDAKIGLTNRHDEAPGSRMRGYIEPSDVTIHENYDKSTFRHDIALIHLTEPFELSPFVRPACLPDPTKEDRLLYRGNAIVTGWGHGEPVSPDAPLEDRDVRPVDNLQQLPLPLKDREACEATIAGHREEDWFDETMTCAGYDQRRLGACKGDSGGPLVKFASNGGRRAWTLIGITSWGRGCAWRDELDFFTNVPHHVPWIQRKMEATAQAAPAK